MSLFSRPDDPQMKPFRVQIVGCGGGHHIERHVMAFNEKEALLCVLNHMPWNDPAWQWAGWQVQVHPARYAFVV